jgi:hypothetical protein
MTLTSEQFNKLVIKEDFNRLEKKVDRLVENMSLVLSAVDGITKEYKDHKVEHASNIVAHDRFESRIKQLEKQKQRR